MRWHLARGESKVSIEGQIRLYRKHGIAVPDCLLEPKMLPGASEWLAAFFDLSTERSFGFSVGPIPSRAIRAWPVDPSEADLFYRCVRAMDRVYLDHASKKPQPISGAMMRSILNE